MIFDKVARESLSSMSLLALGQHFQQGMQQHERQQQQHYLAAPSSCTTTRSTNWDPSEHFGSLKVCSYEVYTFPAAVSCIQILVRTCFIVLFRFEQPADNPIRPH
ncbi:unnamed protein product [Gongylonema pulchrum]|uniref:Uncharacterized protein n=1 Tax=Gongylonema pulchrum TaxID=637853 RepID=A0A183DG19_9BILA|nr:unnamed protein product [Gongylonema pulchrum]